MAKFEDVKVNEDQDIIEGSFEESEMEPNKSGLKKIGAAICNGAKSAANGVKKALPVIGGIVVGAVVTLGVVCVAMAKGEGSDDSESGEDTQDQIESSNDAE